MTAATIALIAALFTFGGGIVGLLYDKLLPEHQVSDETRAIINRVTGLVATMAALVVGLLIASANTFYNSQKSDLEIIRSRSRTRQHVARVWTRRAAHSRAAQGYPDTGVRTRGDVIANRKATRRHTPAISRACAEDRPTRDQHDFMTSDRDPRVDSGTVS